jgi:DNA-binding XRE family transcriptional regulator
MLRNMRKMQNPTHAQALVTLRTGVEVPELLHELYVVQGKSQETIAEELGITRMTVAMWLREAGIARPETPPAEATA